MRRNCFSPPQFNFSLQNKHVIDKPIVYAILRLLQEITMNKNLKQIQLTTKTAKLCATRMFKRGVAIAICPSRMHRMWAVAGYPVVGGGVV